MAIPASRSRVKQVWRSSWQVPWLRPARTRAARMIWSRPGTESGWPRRAPLSATKSASLVVSWSLVVHVASHGGEEGRRQRHQTFVSALAFSDQHPPLAEAQIAETQPEHLAAPQAAQHHGLGHGPVPLGAQRSHERVDLVGVEDPGQPAHPAHQRQAPAAARPALTGGDAPRDWVGRHGDVVAGDQVAIEARDRRQSALDRRGRESRRAIGDAHHVLGTGLRTPLRGDEGHHVLGPHLERDPSSPPRRRRSGHGHRPAPCSDGPARRRTPRTRRSAGGRSDRRVHRRDGRDTRTTDSTPPHTSWSGLHPRRFPRMPIPGGGSPV